jgi:hypothetical protein
LRAIEPLAKKTDEQVLAALEPRDRSLFVAALQTIVGKLQRRD